MRSSIPHIYCGEPLDTFLNFSGRWDERLRLNEAAEARAVAEQDFDQAGWRASQVGYVYQRRGQADMVFDAAAKAEEHWLRAKAGMREQAFAIRLRGIAFQLQKNYAAAIDAYQKVLDIHRLDNMESDDVAIVLNDLCSAKYSSGDIDGAEHDTYIGLQIAQKINNQEGIAIYTGNLASIALERSDWIAAETFARSALRRAETIGKQEEVAGNCSRVAMALAGQRKAVEGLPFARRAVEIYTRLGSPNLAHVREVLAECEAAAKDEEEKK